MATLTSSQIDQIKKLVEQKFPDWTGFSDPRFIREEVDYKKGAIQKARELLNESTLRDLIAA